MVYIGCYVKGNEARRKKNVTRKGLFTSPPCVSPRRYHHKNSLDAMLFMIQPSRTETLSVSLVMSCVYFCTQSGELRFVTITNKTIKIQRTQRYKPTFFIICLLFFHALYS